MSGEEGGFERAEEEGAKSPREDNRPIGPLLSPSPFLGKEWRVIIQGCPDPNPNTVIIIVNQGLLRMASSMEEPLPGHKLCGFLFIALNSSSSEPPPPFSSPCSISYSGFTTDRGVPLSPLGPPLHNARARCKGSRFGMVNGSVSIVRQLHALVSNKCLQVDARVVGTEISEDVVVVVVLADVHLPLDVMTGWQFPRLRSVAASVLQHLRRV